MNGKRGLVKIRSAEDLEREDARLEDLHRIALSRIYRRIWAIGACMALVAGAAVAAYTLGYDGDACLYWGVVAQGLVGVVVLMVPSWP